MKNHLKHNLNKKQFRNFEFSWATVDDIGRYVDDLENKSSKSRT